MNHVILTGGYQGQFVLGPKIISIAFRVNSTGPSSQPPVHVLTRAVSFQPPSATSPRSERPAGPTERGI